MKVLKKTFDLMTSQQMEAFEVDQEPEAMKQLYGDSDFGRGCLMARRLVEVGVPFVEVQFPGSWDLHQDVFNTLKNQRLPMLDSGQVIAVQTD